MYNSTEKKKKSPIKHKDLYKFEPLARRISKCLENDEITLSFQGYGNTLDRYFKLQDNNLTVAFELMTECNLWSQYFSDLGGLIQFKLLDIQLELDILKADYDKKNPDSSIESKIESGTVIMNDFSAFLTQIGVQKSFFTGAFYHCSKLYSKGINTLRYKALD